MSDVVYPYAPGLISWHYDYARMAAAWEAWSATMLPEIPDSFAETYSAAELADHIGT